MRDYEYTVITESKNARDLKDKAEADFPALIDLGPIVLMYFYNFMAYEENLHRMPDDLRNRLLEKISTVNSVEVLELLADLFSWIAEVEKHRAGD